MFIVEGQFVKVSTKKATFIGKITRIVLQSNTDGFAAVLFLQERETSEQIYGSAEIFLQNITKIEILEGGDLNR